MHITLAPFVAAIILAILDTYKSFRGDKSSFGILGYISIFIGHLLFVRSFLINDFTLKEVFLYSSKYLDLAYKFSASWAGSGGFIVWWLFIFTILTSLRRLKSPDSKMTYHNLMIIGLIVAAILNGAFERLNFSPENGLGLNPLLKTFWMLFHPPACFIGYALGFLIAIEVLLGRENRFLIGLTWIFLTLANVLGGVWSYFTLGWGGYWAWDPVETGLLLPWLSLTACFHNPKLRRNLILLTGFSVAFAAFVTRGGISPLHGFGINTSGYAIILLGIPFLVKALKDWHFDFKVNPLNVATYSLIGSYIVCFLGLIYQFFGKVSVDYYNFANMPFILALLSVLPICGAKDYGNYLKLLVLTYISSIVLTALTVFGYITWCEDAPIYVNYAVSLILPVAFFSLLSILKLQRIELKILHVSISLLVIAVSISWPYAYYSNYKSIYVDDSAYIDDLHIQIVSKEFKMGVEESFEIVKLRVNGKDVECRVRLDLNWLFRSGNFIFPDPAVVNIWLDNYYIVIPRAMDLFMFTCKYLYERNETYTLMMVSHVTGLNYETLIEEVKNWKPKEGVMLVYKKIPFINLVWIACALMIFGEIIALARWAK
ncbi:cytochrome c biogenesis protein CcsA [Archaeoglobus profundus]|uniref:Cytochrome c assembly protein n=1 Tax=Archaeoglobus profundus (strain DSM 5631 / JCM 9629 / NBRC 100127 / Av18) TaxID=572546 RepID=D2RHC7_ARCPA|nr:cytochrome c biogenesis protein CcsA [Archaeoglobus profundus]ADB57702.1 cytochrome c assembly protein [Archaeoglobus profundus DSM 5631]